jgi:tRNA/rRNA methyltransferase
MTPRDFGPPTFAPARLSTPWPRSRAPVAFVFGPERTGLANDDVYRCHACLSIPTDPDYGSLNLAQAVQLLAYDWRQALGGFAVQPRTAEAGRPTWGGAGRAGPLAAGAGADRLPRPGAPKKLMPRLQQLALRAQPTAEEVHILRGIARAVRRRAADAGRARLHWPGPDRKARHVQPPA